uniref:DNA polymerase I n=1 Tax=Ningiella ruwaisensis TaxID=2364274 RepID=UPI0010A08BB3|nr:DNA polymerase I [Ningiella ruwaisensis]
MHKHNSAPLVLVDGSSYLFRAFHGLPPLTNSKGQDTGAIYGVVNMLRSLVKEYEPSHMAVVFDAKGKTFRDEIYADYKANRPPMPDELRSQIEPLHAIVKAMGFPIIVEPNVEADDVIGTLAKQATSQGIECVISTGDKDMAQLVSEHVTLINTMTKTKMDLEGVVDKFGVPAELIIDYLALKGDKVDNIPGVPGVGDKSAVAMLNGIGGIHAIYENLDKIADLDFRGAKTMAKKMEEYKEQALLSYELATIACDLKLDYKPTNLQIGEMDKALLKSMFTELEFKKWLAEVSGDADSYVDALEDTNTEQTNNIDPQSESTTSHGEVFDRSAYVTVFDENTLDDLIQELKDADYYAVDTETTSLDYMQAELVGISFATAPNKAYYIPVAHDYPDAPEQLSRELVLSKLKALLEDKQAKKIGQHIKYDKNVLANYDIELNGILSDTMLASYVLNSVATRHDMDSLSLKYLGHKCIGFEEIAGKGAKQLTFNQLSLDTASAYAAEDADVTLRLYETLRTLLDKQDGLSDVLNNIEVPLSSVLAKVEQTGVLIDSQMLAQQSQTLAKRIVELEKQVHELAGESFNLGSTKQLQHILFDKMSLPVVKKTPKGAPSTSEDVLQDLANDYELPALIMQYRGLTKLKNTYTDKLPKMINHRTNRVHTSYHQAVAATGRLSSSDPNLQNIPIRTSEGRQVRQAFVPQEGYKIVAADYSQIELRIMAHLSKDEGLLKAFAQGKDIHSATASDVFSVELDKVTADQRRSAKAINFGLIYGMSAFGLSKQLHISRAEAQNYMDLYFKRYPGVLKYMESTRESAKEKGYVSTVFGRRLYLPDINASNGARRKGAERAAINAPMQGTAADIIKKAMIDVAAWIDGLSQQNEIIMIMQVHDELVFEIKEEKLDTYIDKICDIMQNCVSLDVPLEVEAGVGKNWDEAH